MNNRQIFATAFVLGSAIACNAFGFSPKSTPLSSRNSTTESNIPQTASLIDSLQQLNEVIIAENRLQIPFNKQNRNIQIIDRKLIESLPAKSLNELLTYIPGVDLRQRGPFGSQADISMDGGTFEQTLILINGVKINDIQSGHNTMNLPIPTEAIERIEILHGPAARIYGINSISGAINIVTVKPTKNTLHANVYGGSSFKKSETNDKLYLGKGAQIGGSYAKNLHNHLLYGGYESGNGYRYNTDFENYRLFYQGALKTSESNRFELMAGIARNAFGANGFYAAPGDKEAYEIASNNLLSAVYHVHVNDRLYIAPRLSMRNGKDDYRYIRQDLSKFRNQHTTQVFNAEINSTYRLDAGSIGFGLEGRNEIIESNNLGDHTRENYGIYGEFSTDQIERLSLNVGAYVNYNSKFGWQVFPGLDVGYDLSSDWKVFINSGTGQRIPSFTDLYYNTPGNIGNANLEAETAWYAEGGVKYNRNHLSLQTSYFHRQTDNFTDWIKAVNTDPWQIGNFSQSNINGINVSGDYRTNLGAGQSLLLGLGYTYLSASFKQNFAEGFISKYAIENLKHQAVAKANYTYKSLGLTLATRFCERVNQKNYVLADVRASYKVGLCNIYADFQNIFDVTYIEAAAVPMPGNWVSLGCKFSMDMGK